MKRTTDRRRGWERNSQKRCKDFRSAYLETVYAAGGVSWVFSSEDCGLELYNGRRFALITAANPRSEAWQEADNDQRNAELRHEIAAKGWAFGESVGSSPSGDWREYGCLIWDAPLDEIVKIGQRYGQNAICHGEAGRVALVWCDDGETEWFYATAFPKFVAASPPQTWRVTRVETAACLR